MIFNMKIKFNDFLSEKNNDNIFWFHASPYKFEVFENSNDIGFHFGTKEQAIDRMKQQKIKNFYLYKVNLFYNNPLITIDKKTWFGLNLLDILSINKLVNRKNMLDKLEQLKKQYKYDSNGKIIDNWSTKALNEWNDDLKHILYTSEYDSIIYQNKFEDKTKFENSIIVFSNKQIKIIDIEKI